MKEYINHIVTNKLSGNQVSSEDSQLLEKWLMESENLNTFNELKKVWEVTGHIDYSMQVDVDKEWINFQLIRKTKTSKRIFYTITSIAASIVLVIGLFVMFANQTVTYQYSANENHIVLPDNSEVWLNKGAEITLNKKFGNSDRQLALSGEAFFEVTKDPNKPFIVNIPSGVAVKVLGTSFNLNSSFRNNTVHLQVISGVVEFGNINSKIIEVVKKGNEATYYTNQKKIVKKVSKNLNKLSWHTGEFSFNNESLEQVVEMLSTYLAVNIVLPESMLSTRYSGKFSQPTSQDVADILSQALGLKYDLKKKTLTFFAE